MDEETARYSDYELVSPYVATEFKEDTDTTVLIRAYALPIIAAFY